MTVPSDGSKPRYVVIGTSGSTDYLRDATSDKRFWPVGSDPEASCDGIHDEGAPIQYLCTRCFPDGRSPHGDLAEPCPDITDDEYRAEPEEIE